MNDLYGANAPFSRSNGVDVVHLMVEGNQNEVISSFLLFHKVQKPNTNAYVTTGFAVVRDGTKVTIMGDCSEDITDSIYNANGVDPTAIRVYGFEAFDFHSISDYQNIMKISTSDGKTSQCTKDTDTVKGRSVEKEFYGNYKWTPPPCPYGCTCASGVCTACIQNAYHRVFATIDGVTSCPCMNGFYQNTDKLCVSCPRELNCDTCSLVGGTPTCTACKCSQHRELSNSNTCDCIAGYQEATPTGAYCVRS